MPRVGNKAISIANEHLAVITIELDVVGGMKLALDALKVRSPSVSINHFDDMIVFRSVCNTLKLLAETRSANWALSPNSIVYP